MTEDHPTLKYEERQACEDKIEKRYDSSFQTYLMVMTKLMQIYSSRNKIMDLTFQKADSVKY